MRGILWRWLFFFGALLWISLCLADYHKKYLQMNLKPIVHQDIDLKIELPVPPILQIVPQPKKLQPPKPALTFWKFLSIVFSVSAIVIIKRLSSFRKKNLPSTSCSDFDFDRIRPPYSNYISRVPPLNNNTYNSLHQHQEFQVSRLETNLSAGDTKPTALVGVKIVQKKLEDLENNIATLKQRINNNSSSTPSSVATDPKKRAFEQNQSYFGLATSNTSETHSTLSTTPLTTEMKTRQEILLNHTRPVTPTDFSIQNLEKTLTPGKSSCSSGGSTFKTKEMKLLQNESELDIISLKELKDSVSGKSSSFKTRKTCSKLFDESYGNVRIETPQLKTNSISLASFNLSSIHINKKNSSRNFRKKTKYQTSTFSDSKTNSTSPSVSSRKSLDGSSKSLPGDENSSTKMFTDSNPSTSTLTSLKKKRCLKTMKSRKRELKGMSPVTTSLATYLPRNFHSPAFSRTRHVSSYAAINRKKTQVRKELGMNSGEKSAYDQISATSSNESTDSIDKFVAKVLKPDSDVMLKKNSSDELSMASTSISSLTASSSFISPTIPKFDSITSSIRSILPLTHTTVSSNFSTLGNSRNMPAGAEPLSSGESIVEKNAQKYGTKLAIHSLAMDYLQTLQEKKFDSDSQEKFHDSGSEFSFTTKSVMDKYRSRPKDSSVALSHKNILEDKYWLLHW